MRARIFELFTKDGASDQEILHVLKCENSEVAVKTLSRLRKDMDLWRRLSVFERSQQEAGLEEIIRDELNEGPIEGYGHRLLYTHFKISGVIATRYGLLGL